MSALDKNRLGTDTVTEVFKRGTTVQGPHTTLRFMRSAAPGHALVPIIPKTVAASAVERNRLRRVLREELRALISGVSVGVIGVVVIKKKNLPPRPVLRQEILALLEKSAILNK